MNNKLQLAFVSICILFISYSFTHPIKLTSSLIKYDDSKKNITIECKVFIDDFAPALHSTLEQKIKDLNLTKNDLEIIENYFLSKYKFFINGNNLQLELNSYKVKDNVLTLSLFISNIGIQKGDKLEIQNELLFEKFPELQSNWMTIQMPPYIRNYSFESNFENFSYSHIF